MVFTDTLGVSHCLGNSPRTQVLNRVDNLIDGMCSSENANAHPLPDDSGGVKSKLCRPHGRSLSECSVDSEDSFIVFESSGTISINWDDDDDMSIVEDSDDESTETDGESTDSESSDTETDSDAEGDSGDENNDATEDVCDGLAELVEEVNQCWQLENPSVAHKRKSDVLQKRVCFAPPETLETVHKIVAWDFAYRRARIGPWEQMVRDRDRFNKRIKRTEEILAPVLSLTHRKRMLERREELAPSVV